MYVFTFIVMNFSTDDIFTLRHRGCNKSLFLQIDLLLRLSLEKLGYYDDKGEDVRAFNLIFIMYILFTS